VCRRLWPPECGAYHWEKARAQWADSTEPMARFTEQQIAAKLRALEAACHRRRLPVTVQRRVVYEALLRSADHPTADQLYHQVRRRLPAISRTTVYRVLETLVELGLAMRVPNRRAVVRYDPNTERHHHLICVVCDRVQDWEGGAMEVAPLEERDELEGYQVLDYSVVIRGICPACRAASHA